MGEASGALEAGLARPPQCGVAHCLVGRVALRQSIEAGQFTAAAETDERHFVALTWLVANGRACGNVEPHAERGGAIEVQRLVHLEEMIMRTDLHWAVAGIDDGERR